MTNNGSLKSAVKTRCLLQASYLPPALLADDRAILRASCGSLIVPQTDYSHLQFPNKLADPLDGFFTLISPSCFGTRMTFPWFALRAGSNETSSGLQTFIPIECIPPETSVRGWGLENTFCRLVSKLRSVLGDSDRRAHHIRTSAPRSLVWINIQESQTSVAGNSAQLSGGRALWDSNMLTASREPL